MPEYNKKWDPGFLLKIKQKFKDEKFHFLFDKIFIRYEKIVLPYFLALKNTDIDHFNAHKMSQLSTLLLDEINTIEEIYFTAGKVISTFCKQQPLTEIEAETLFDFMIIDFCCRLLTHGNKSSLSKKTRLFIRQWIKLDIYFLNAIARDAAGYFATAESQDVIAWLESPDCKPRSLFNFDLNKAKQITLYFDQSQHHISMIHDVNAHQKYVEEQLVTAQARYAIGLYGENRACYQTSMFESKGCHEKRCVHMGIDVFLEAEETLFAPIKGRVYSLQYNAEALDYGYTIILEHIAGNRGTLFYTLYGHLSHRTLGLISEGDVIEAGAPIGYIGNNTENGGWSPHLHFQIMTNMLSCQGDFYGACEPSFWYLWKQICPDPNLLMKVLITENSFVQ